MDGSRLRLTGVGEGFSTRITTSLRGVDSPAKVLQALQCLFPDAERPELEDEPTLGLPVNAAWEFKDVSLGAFLQQLHEQRILDTALDAMSMNIDGDSTTFAYHAKQPSQERWRFPSPAMNRSEECSPSP